jgi:hypothetical protein
MTILIMKQARFRVHCALADCYYYLKEEDNPLTGEANLIFCTYPERDLTDDARACPYYRMDWQKKMKLVQEKIKANKAAKLKAQSQPHPAAAAVASVVPAETKLDSPNIPEPPPPIIPPDILFEQDNNLNPKDAKPQDEKDSEPITPPPQSK